ncbi:VOC family protein [Photobacterium makurazakiensis]|uniref:VOC family protein n=1 Tax=Photobacterium makurazakiensis TaxID=2910234 RepID=UPI003D09ECF2
MANLFKQHGAFSWSELMTDDPEKALEFYTQTIGWEVEAMPMPQGTYHVLKANGEPVGGVMAKPEGYEHIPNHWGTYVTVDNVDATLEKVVAAGGKAIYEPMDVPGVGRMCAINDPDGAVISIITYESPDCHE